MYRALYRKWRPQRFEDVVAQHGTVTALRNQVAAGRVGHAYLFTGVRGTGKTTCAKIFAKAVNCLNPHDGDPCCQCSICRGIDDGSILDVVEMDAASNNGVDDIRGLRDETAYTPSECRYKVYIIDEVHMLSTAAFNALLKTLEEPPAHVIFILATTEIQKVPETILSRCQRYDFARIVPEDIARRVEYIAGEEHLQLTTEGAELISRLADGAMRDALSILDTCAGVTSQIDASVVRKMAGVTDRSYLFRISDAIAAQDGATALACLAQLRQQDSVDIKRLTDELIAHYRALMLAALPGGQALLTGVSPEEEALYLQKARRWASGNPSGPSGCWATRWSTWPAAATSALSWNWHWSIWQSRCSLWRSRYRPFRPVPLPPLLRKPPALCGRTGPAATLCERPCGPGAAGSGRPGPGGYCPRRPAGACPGPCRTGGSSSHPRRAAGAGERRRPPVGRARAAHAAGRTGSGTARNACPGFHAAAAESGLRGRSRP